MTRAELRSLFKSLIDEQDTGVFSDTRINELLFEGAQEVQDQIEIQDENYFITVEDISVTADGTSIALDSKTRKIIEVQRVDTDENLKYQYVELRNLSEYRRRYGDNIQSVYPVYSVRNNNILYPNSMGIDHTIRVQKTIQLVNLTDDSEEWSDIPAIAQRNIAYEAAMIGLVAEDSDIRQFQIIIAGRRRSLVENMNNRVRSEPRSVNYIPEDY